MVEAIGILLNQQVSRLLLEIVDILLLDSCDELLEQVLLELIVVLLVRVWEALARLWEAANVAYFDILAALLESLLNIAFHVKNLLLHGGVPVIFNRVVCAAFKVCSDDGPLIIELAVQDVQDELLFLTPLVFLDLWVQVVVPSLTALLSNAAWQVVGNVCPFHSTGGLYER